MRMQKLCYVAASCGMQHILKPSSVSSTLWHWSGVSHKHQGTAPNGFCVESAARRKACHVAHSAGSAVAHRHVHACCGAFSLCAKGRRYYQQPGSADSTCCQRCSACSKTSKASKVPVSGAAMQLHRPLALRMHACITRTMTQQSWVACNLHSATWMTKMIELAQFAFLMQR